MSTINQELLGLLQRKFGTGKTQVYWHIARKREATGLSRALAAVALALELGIDVSRFATEFDLKKIRDAEPGLQSLIDSVLPEKQTIASAVERVQRQTETKHPFTDQRMITNAYTNATICAKLFLFENSLRRAVYAVMEREFGLDWWYDKTPRDIMYKTFDRRAGEDGPRWRGHVGADPICYTDIRDLQRIIERHQEAFHKVLGKPFDISAWVAPVEKVRAALATANPVTRKDQRDFTRILERWKRLSGRIERETRPKRPRRTA